VRVLVTGATGFVGRWLLPELEAAGHEAISAPPSAELDLGASPDLAPLIRATKPDAVAHLAAISYVPAATGDPDLARRVNVDGTRALFTGLEAAGSRATVLITSSAAVYGNAEELPIRETALLRPESPYGETKLAQERVAAGAAWRGRSVVIARAFNHIGPGQRPVFVAPKFARDVLRLRSGAIDSVPVGDIEVRRDYVDVRDVAFAYRLLLEKVHAVPAELRTYNVGSGHSVAIRELLTRLFELAGVEPRWHVDPALLRPGEVCDGYADISAITSLTGWQPRIPLEQSLRDLLAASAA